MDSLLGVKYIYSREPITGCEQIRQDILDGIRLYRNPYALPLGYAVNNLETAEDYGTNVFENQTLLCKHLSGQETVSTPVPKSSLRIPMEFMDLLGT